MVAVAADIAAFVLCKDNQNKLSNQSSELFVILRNAIKQDIRFNVFSSAVSLALELASRQR